MFFTDSFRVQGLNMSKKENLRDRFVSDMFKTLIYVSQLRAIVYHGLLEYLHTKAFG